MNHDEDIPYRSPARVDLPAVDRASSVDEGHFDTLKAVRNDFTTAMRNIDSWHAFDLEETEMPVNVQILAHRLAYEILQPLLDALNSSIEAVDSKYKEN